VNSKYNLIIKNIEKTGFKNNANIFSLSDTSKFGGEIGWISQTHLNESLLKEIELLNINEISKPIQTSSGYLIIKLNDKRKKELKFDKEKLYNRMIVEEKNRQLNQFSLIYFKKIKQNIFISEK
jgi:peptidyl-prolyl cis-trans isomerase SurA